MMSYTFFYRNSHDSDYRMFIVQNSDYSTAVSSFISFFEKLESSFKDFTGFYHCSDVNGTIIDCIDKDDFDLLLSYAHCCKGVSV